MNHLYLVEHIVEGETFLSPCVGEEELSVHVAMAEEYGADSFRIIDIEYELNRFMWDCCFEGQMKEWLNAQHG